MCKLFRPFGRGNHPQLGDENEKTMAITVTTYKSGDDPPNGVLSIPVSQSSPRYIACLLGNPYIETSIATGIFGGFSIPIHTSP